MVVVTKENDVKVDVVVTTTVRARLLRFATLSSLGDKMEEETSGMIESLCSTASNVGTNLDLKKIYLVWSFI